MIDRARAIIALGALTAGALAPCALAGAQSSPSFVDVHHHFFPKPLIDVMNAWQTRHGEGPVLGPVAAWSPERSLEQMDRSGVGLAFVELASPRRLWWDLEPKAVAALSRTCNEYAAEMVRSHRGRFGFFASLPMPDVEASLAEIAYALDTLGADGIGLPTSFGTRYPGERAFDPVYAELNRRKAVVTLHGYAPNCCAGIAPGVPDSVLEYPYDAGRAVLNLLAAGVFVRYRDIRWIVPYGGGPIPAFAGRVDTLMRLNRVDPATIAPNGFDAELQRLYYDTANAAYKPSMDALLDFIPTAHVLFGTDFPYVGVGQNVDGLAKLQLGAKLAAIARANVATLLPRARATGS